MSSQTPEVLPPKTGQSVRLSNVSVTAAARQLLDNVSVDFPAQEITLIVGPSGVGKSILLRMIAGLTDTFESAIRVQGEVLIDDRSAAAGDSGVVFQNFALFDEMSPAENLSFAKSNAAGEPLKQTPLELLDQLRVPANVPTSRLSGGQRQRLALVRTLMFNPSVILYDEPTSGLDPLTGKQVAQLIEQTHQQYGKTSIIVTHDYRSLLPIADRVFLLNPETQSLSEMPSDQWGNIEDALQPMATKVRKSEEVDEFPLVSDLQGRVTDFFVGTTQSLTALICGVPALVPLWKNPRWGLRYFWHFLMLVMGPTACLYLIAAGLISGFVTTYFTFKFLPYSAYTEPLLLEDLLTALGFATYRIFVPVLACVLIAARCGAAITADIGGRQFGNQLDAMTTFGVPPKRYLLTPIIWSFLICAPVLTFLSFFAARLVSLIVFVFTHPDHGANLWHYYFHRGLEEPDTFFYRGFGWLLAKLLCSGFGIAVIAYHGGISPKRSSTDVSRSVTRTILWATLFVLLVHFVFAFLEFENIVPGGR